MISQKMELIITITYGVIEKKVKRLREPPKS